MLTIPVKSRGRIDRVPHFSSTLSIMKIEMMEVKAIVICGNYGPHIKIITRIYSYRIMAYLRNPKLHRKKTYRQAVPDKTSIIWFEMIVSGSKSNSCNANEKTCPTQ